MKTAIMCTLILVCCIALFAQQPAWEWAQQLKYPADWKMALDSEGNIYLTGEFDSTAVFGNTTLSCKGKSDVFVAKMSQDGQWLWAIQSNNASYVTGFCIDIDTMGDIVISGMFKGSCGFGKTNLTCSGDEGMYVAKLDKMGNWLWAIQAGGDSYMYVLYLETDRTGNIFLSGKFQAKAALGDTTLYSMPTCFISKLDKDGNWLWSKKINGKSDVPHPISLDAAGNLYFSGNFSGYITIADTMVASSGLTNSFVAKLDTNGKLQWLARNEGKLGSTIWSITTDKAGNSYITGNGSKKLWFGKHTINCSLVNIFVAKLDTNGNWLWAKSAKTKDYQFACGISLDNTENPVITGTFAGKTILGKFKLKKVGDWEMLVAGLDKKGKWLWALQGGGKSNAEGHTLLIDKDNNAYICGLYYAADMILGKQTLRYSGTDNDNFIAKLKIK